MIVDFINVGYGDSILIEDRKKIILIDGGGNREDMYCQPGVVRTIDYLREKNIEKIDIVIITHFHEDHICGLVSVIEQMTIGQIWINVLEKNIPSDFLKRIKDINDDKLELFIKGIESYINIIDIAKDRQIPLIEMGKCKPCEGIELLGDNEEQLELYKMKLGKFFYEKDKKKLLEEAYNIDQTANKHSLAVKIKGDDGYALLMSDRIIGGDAENKYVYDKSYDGSRILSLLYHISHQSAQLDSTIKLLKLPHHGQTGCITTEILENIRPDNVVITSDNNNTFGGGALDVINKINKFYKNNKIPGKVYITGKEEQDGRYKSNISFDI